LDLGLKAITISCVAIFAFAGCNRSDVKIAGPLPQRGYIWQREWSPVVIDSLRGTGNRYYQIIDHRCAKTTIGQADTAKHWFVIKAGHGARLKKKHIELCTRNWSRNAHQNNSRDSQELPSNYDCQQAHRQEQTDLNPMSE
jgi:hypothetical protein